MTKDGKAGASPRTTAARAVPARVRWDWNSRPGRAALRLGILREMVKPPVPLPRGVVADGIGIGNSERALEAVSAALKALTGTGHVVRSGSGPTTAYEITAAGIEAAKAGGK